MRKFLLCLSVVLLNQTQAAQLEIYTACSEHAVKTIEFKADLTASLGKNTVNVLDHHQIPYLGNEIGLNSILGTPTGEEAIEILSDQKMRAYGLCFSIDGIIPDVLAGNTLLPHQNSKIVWFFAYSTYDNGEWTDYCVPAYTIRSAQFCKKD